MSIPKASAAHASVVVIKVRDFARKPVAEQAALKAKLDEAIAAGVAGLREDERIVLDTPSGAAIVVLGNPGAALDVAMRAADAANDPHIAAGINHGPVRVVEAASGPVIVGDGIAAADAIADLAPAGRLAAAREFRDALSHAAPGRARHLARAGTHTDAHDRAHDLFFADRAAFASRRWRIAGVSVLLFVAIVGAAAIARAVLARIAAAAPATLVFEVRPPGEISIDGVPRGKSPPLQQLQLPPGVHTIVIERALSKTVTQEVKLAPGEILVVRHVVAATPPKAPAKAREREREPQKPFWRRFMDQFK